MKALVTFFVLVLSVYSNAVNAQGWQWAAGSTGGSEGFGIAVDHWGNVFVSGFAGGLAGGSLDFGGGVTLSGLGASAAVVVKYDTYGNIVWANSTLNSFAKPINIAINDSGDLFLLGYYISPSVHIGPFTLTNPYPPANELFLAKFTPSGNVSWAINLFPGEITGNLVVSGANLYLASTFNDPAITVGAYTLTNADPSGTTDDIVLVKTDFSGNIAWAKSFGGASNDNALIALAPSGNVYMSGTSASPLISFGSATLVNPDTSFFVVKFDTAFNAVWAKREPGIGKIGSFVSGVTTGLFEDIYVTGSWRPTASFGTHILPADSVSNIYLVKYDSAGSLKWLAEATGNGQLYGSGVTTDVCGNVWISGALGDQTPGHHGSHYIKINGVEIDTPNQSTDPLFIAEWTATGTYVKSALLPTGGDDANSIGTDGLGNIYIGGDYWYGPYTIAGKYLRDPLQPSENIFAVKYLNNTEDTTFLKSTICMTDSVVLQAPSGYTWYQWENGSPGTSRTIYSPGQYKLYGTGNCGSGVLLDVFTIEYGKLDTVYEHTDTSACTHAHSVLSAPAGYSPYLWNDGTTAQTDIITSPGTYWVIATGTCTVSTVIDTFVVTGNNIDLAFSLGNDTDICTPLLLTVPVAGASYLWQDGSSGDSYLADNTGIYAVTISELACFSSDTIAVNFIDLSQHLNDTVVCREWPVQLILKANVPQAARHSSILWSTGSTQTAIAVNEPGSYSVTVTDDGCIGTGSMTYGVMYCSCEATLPDAFTPNGDGKNDLYYPILNQLCDVFDYTFGIYDRWGNLVFWSHDLSAKWDGRYNGIPCDIGVYMYFVKYRVGDIFHEHLQKGDFTLLR